MRRTLKRIGCGLLAGLALYGAFFAFQTLRPRDLALSLPDAAQPGDVVLMRSHTWRAELVRVVDGVPYRDGWSHVGLVHKRDADGVWTIVHAVPGAEGTVRVERWPDVARGGGISAVQLLRAPALDDLLRARLVDLQANAAARAVPFDSGFDHHDDTALYCTELVTDLYAKAGVDAVGADVLAKRAIFPGHLVQSRHLSAVNRD